MGLLGPCRRGGCVCNLGVYKQDCVGCHPDLDGLCVRCRVRAAINTHSDFDKAMADLTAFFARLTADPPSGKPLTGKRAHSTSAAQLSSGVGPGGRSGKPHSSGPGHSGQPRKIADTAGEKAPDLWEGMTQDALYLWGSITIVLTEERLTNQRKEHYSAAPSMQLLPFQRLEVLSTVQAGSDRQ